MAILVTNQLVELRQRLAAKFPSVNYTKDQARLALQAIEDWFETNKSALVLAIDTATTPLVLTAAQKKAFVAAFILQKAGRESS